MAVARAVGLAGDVDPVFAMGMLEDEQVEVGMVLQEIKPSVLNGYVFYKDCVGFRRFQRVQGVHVIIACSLLKDVDRVVLNV